MLGIIYTLASAIIPINYLVASIIASYIFCCKEHSNNNPNILMPLDIPM